MNVRTAPESVARAVARRLSRHNPGARLVPDTVKLCALPGNEFDATLFIFISPDGNARVFAAELAREGLPHVYSACKLPPDGNAAGTAKVMAGAIASLTKTITTDPRFRRHIIRLNGFLLPARSKIK